MFSLYIYIYCGEPTNMKVFGGSPQYLDNHPGLTAHMLFHGYGYELQTGMHQSPILNESDCRDSGALSVIKIQEI